MSDQMALVPLSQPLGVGQWDKPASERDNAGTPSGTIGLKALAAKVLRRDAERDNGGTNASNSCPTLAQQVGQTFEPPPRVPGHGRAPIIEKPLLMRDGRRLWRIPAGDIPAAGDGATRAAVDEARHLGCVLVGDGADLVLVEPWLSRLSDDIRDALTADARAVITLLRGESRRRDGENC